MKTTLELPDTILRKAKILAAERDTSLKDLVTQALERFIDAPVEAEERNRRASMKKLLKAMRASSSEPMKPLRREQTHDR